VDIIPQNDGFGYRIAWYLTVAEWCFLRRKWLYANC